MPDIESTTARQTPRSDAEQSEVTVVQEATRPVTPTVNDISKLSTLLDDPEVQELLYGLGHVVAAPPAASSGVYRLHAVVLSLAGTTTVEQYHSWLSDETSNLPMTVDQVRLTVGDSAIDDLAQFLSGSPGAVAWQLAATLPDFVDAVSPGGEVIDVTRLAMEWTDASAADDRSAGAFGSRVY